MNPAGVREPLTAAPKPSRQRGLVPRLAVALGTGLIALVVLVGLYSHNHYPPMPGTVHLQLTFPAGRSGEKVEPILETGMFREGDMVVIRYLDETTAEFAYDHWYGGGPTSQRITFVPGSRHSLDVTLPSLTAYAKPPEGARGLVRFVYDGREILREELPYYARLPKQVYFGENAIGGSTWPFFRGEVTRPGGHIVKGGSPENYFTTTECVLQWVKKKPWQALRVLLGSIAIGVVCAWFFFHTVLRSALRLGRRLLALVPHRRFVIPAALATLGYTWLVTMGTFNFNYAEIFGNFYDYQARSFLQGRLDVPEDAIGGEAFEANGKVYGYFGPTPALLRLPFVAVGVAFGKLSRPLMVAYFIASLVAAYFILRYAVKTARGDSSGEAEPSPLATSVLVASVGFGSTICFLGSRGLIFHEAILAGITFALWSVWCSLRYLQTPARRWWVWALALGICSLHCRPPTGLFSLTFLGCVALALIWREWRRRDATVLRRVLPHVGVGVACLVGQLSLNALAYAKFNTFDPAPLRISRPYMHNDRLAHIDGKSFHLVNLPFNFYTYLIRPNLRVEPSFPWIYLGSNEPGHFFPEAKIDLPDHTLAMPYAMPSLFFLATLGALAGFIALPAHRWPIALLWLAAIPMTLALFAAIATAQRYTGDFCPLLIAGAAFGLAALDHTPHPWRALLQALTVAVALAGMAVSIAITLQYQGDYLWGVPEEKQQQYKQLRLRVDRFFSAAPSRDR